jgi:hypothetical protein
MKTHNLLTILRTGLFSVALLAAVTVHAQVTDTVAPITANQNTDVANTAPVPAGVATAPNQPAFPVKNIRWRRLEPNLPEDIKTAGLYFEFKSAPSYTAKFNEALKAAGYTLAAAGTAKYSLVFEARFSSDGKTQTMVDLGQIIEEGSLNNQGITTTMAVSGQDIASRASDMAYTGLIVQKALDAGLMDRVMAGGNILEGILKASGLKDKFNTLLTGDRRGMCLLGCSKFEWSEQHAVLAAREAPDWGQPGKKGIVMGVDLFSARMWPQEMTTMLLVELNRYFSLAQATAPEAPALMTLREQVDAMKSIFKVEE